MGLVASGSVKTYAAAGPWAIAPGSDGALWFTGSGGIGRITTEGVVSNYTDARIESVRDITLGPAGALWFTNHESIGRITTSGEVSIIR